MLILRSFRALLITMTTLSLAACGLGQTVTDGATKAARWAFTTEVPAMNLDVVYRAPSHTDAASSADPAIVRIYQLQHPDVFKTLDDGALFANDRHALTDDLFILRDVVLRPGASASLRIPMSPDARDVGIVAFVSGGNRRVASRLLIAKKRWAQADPVRLDLDDDALRFHQLPR